MFYKLLESPHPSIPLFTSLLFWRYGFLKQWGNLCHKCESEIFTRKEKAEGRPWLRKDTQNVLLGRESHWHGRWVLLLAIRAYLRKAEIIPAGISGSSKVNFGVAKKLQRAGLAHKTANCLGFFNQCLLLCPWPQPDLQILASDSH